jgi:hypothetical protein
MTRSALLLAAALLAAAAPPAHWLLEERVAPGTEVELNLARAAVRVVHRAGPLRIELRSRGRAGLHGVEFKVVRTAARLSVTDIYPAPLAAAGRMAECAPPAGERGDVSGTHVRLDAIVYAPPEVRVAVRLLGPLEPA